MPINIGEFKASLSECTDGLLIAYVAACDEEMAARRAKEMDRLKEILESLERDELERVLETLGLELVSSRQSKKHTDKKRLPYGYKEYTYADEKYYVVPYFNRELKVISQGTMASWLKHLSKEERDDRFNTVNLLDRSIVKLADLINAHPQSVQWIVDGQVQCVTLERVKEAEEKARCAVQEVELTSETLVEAESARVHRKGQRKGAHSLE